MHGRPRKPTKAEDPAASAAKAEKLRSLQNQLLHNHHNRIYTKEALEISSKLLEVNPEVYTAWNYRKLAVQSILQSLPDPSDVISVVNGELRIVEIALRRNPKCYGAWHHRKWVLTRELLPTDYDHEFQLLDQLLKADSRNFHGWNYRRFVAALKNVSEEDELKFMTDKINANFSNYSAWHNRSVLLSQLLKKNTDDSFRREKVLTDEFELVHQALFTDPDDQSGWFYYLWLLDQTTASHDLALISSWPANGSNLVLSSNRSTDGSQSDYVLHKRTVPIVLHFSKAVTGVNSSTVTVESSFNKNEDLTWRPLSNINSGEAHCWVAYLRIPEANCDTSNAYTVMVSLGYSQDIISSNGSQYNCPYRSTFTVHSGSEKTEGELEEIFVWEDSNSYINTDLLQEVNSTMSLGQLRVTKDVEPSASKWHIETLSNEISLFRELLSEINCKIAKLTIARLLVALDGFMSSETISTQKRIHSDEVLQLYDDLMKLDLSHIRYYKDECSLVLMDRVTTDEELLAKHCWRITKSTRFRNHKFLRFNNLPLSRIGFVERLLWVQILDLSHNELKSIEGLQAMQFLSCLNLSNNKISSFSALEPLKSIGSLEVLDISHNEIGAHSIDTTRYLCDSPLSHSTRSNWNIEKYHQDNLKIACHWEAILLFQDMQLIQLDIKGNAVATEEFWMLLGKVLPILKWFDGVHV